MLRNEKGFTLIELIMIIIILGILAAIAVPKYADLQNQARNAVLDASIGAVKSAAIILYASKIPSPSANTLAAIMASTELDSAVGLTSGVTQCGQSLSLTHTGGGSRSFSLSTTYCSN
jgi:MSHA pilin protein MshA